MRPASLEQIGGDLAIKWEDGLESFIPLEKLRRFCPCAGCRGEQDILGNLYKDPDQPLSSPAFELRDLVRVGSYAIQPLWGDGHFSGIYSFEYLRRLAEMGGGPESQENS